MANLAALLYLVSGVLFILALRGLSHPTTSQQGNRFGMIGMGIAIVTTLALRPPSSFGSFVLLVLGIGIGGGFGAVLAKRVEMTKMPQLVAFFHSLVGLAAVLVAAVGLVRARRLRHRHSRRHSRRQPDRNVARRGHRRHHLYGLGDRVPEARRPHGRQADHAAAAPHHQRRLGRSAGRVASCCSSRPAASLLFWLIVLISLALGVLLIIPIGGADMPVVVSMLNSYSGWAAAGIGFTLGNMALIITGALVGSSARSCPTSCARA